MASGKGRFSVSGGARHLGRAWLVGVVAAAVACTATSGPNASPSSAATASQAGTASAQPAQGELLTYAAGGPPNGINPAKIGVGGSVLFLAPMYESYIYEKPDGTFRGGLAQSYGYVAGSNNQSFTMTLRSGLKFSDGTDLTAQVVADNILYQKGAGFPPSGFLRSISTVTASGPLTVDIKLSEPNPMLPLTFSQFWPQGFPVAAVALKDPSILEKNSYGIGPYVLDSANTVLNDTYTYKPNPLYYEQSHIHYKKLVIKVIPDENARLAALRTGQVDVMGGSIATVDAATAAGLQVGHALARNIALWILDRDGQLVKPLGDVRVRQALNYAVNRPAITKALVGAYGKPTVQPGVEGFDMYDPALESKYPFDPAKAKQLLADAGYPNGFSMTIVTAASVAAQAQAIAGYLADIGVKVDYFNDNTVAAQVSGKYPVDIFNYSGHLGVLLAQAVLPSAPVNPFHSTTPELASLIQQYQTADATQGPVVAKKISAYLVDQAWFLPIFNGEQIWYASPKVGGFNVTPAWNVLDPTEWYQK